MRTGRPTKPLDISAEERQKLELLARRPKSSQALAMRARIGPIDTDFFQTITNDYCLKHAAVADHD